jgi:hypothetical protein
MCRVQSNNTYYVRNLLIFYHKLNCLPLAGLSSLKRLARFKSSTLL